MTDSEKMMLLLYRSIERNRPTPRRRVGNFTLKERIRLKKAVITGNVRIENDWAYLTAVGKKQLLTYNRNAVPTSPQNIFTN